MEQLSLFPTQKRCSKCRAIKALADFSRNKNAHDGLQAQCKVCNRAYYEANRERIKATLKARYWADPEKARANGRLSWWRHAEKRRADAREYQRTHDRLAYKREWRRRDRAANPEKWREKSRREYWQNAEAHRLTQHRRRARRLAAMIVDIATAALAARWDFFGGRCWLCGGDATEWDHVKPLNKGGAHILSNLRPACLSCNRRKSDRWPL